MAGLSERERIDISIMMGYEDKLQSHVKACALFNEVHNERAQISRSTQNKFLARYQETRSVKDLSTSGRPKMNHNPKLNAY